MRTAFIILLITCFLSSCEKPKTQLQKHYVKANTETQLGSDALEFLDDNLRWHEIVRRWDLGEINEGNWKRIANPKHLFFETTQSDHFYFFRLTTLAALQKSDPDMAMLAFDYGLEMVRVKSSLPQLEAEIERNGGRDKIIAELNNLCSDLAPELAPLIEEKLSHAAGYSQEGGKSNIYYLPPRDAYEHTAVWRQSRLVDCAIKSNQPDYFRAIFSIFALMADENIPQNKPQNSTSMWAYLVRHAPSQAQIVSNMFADAEKNIDTKSMGGSLRPKAQKRLSAAFSLLEFVDHDKAIQVACDRIKRDYIPGLPIYLYILDKAKNRCLFDTIVRHITEDSASRMMGLEQKLAKYNPSFAELHGLSIRKYKAKKNVSYFRAKDALTRRADANFAKDAKKLYRMNICSTDLDEKTFANSRLAHLEEFDFLAGALKSCGDLRMANSYLNSKIEQLEEAARIWASARGYSIRLRNICDDTDFRGICP